MHGFTDEENELKKVVTWVHSLAPSSKVLGGSLGTLTFLITIDAKFPEDICVRGRHVEHRNTERVLC